MSESVVGARIKSLRLRAGLTQEGLAVRASLSGPTISRLERGTQRFRLEQLAVVAKALGVTVGRLIGNGKAKSKAA